MPTYFECLDCRSITQLVSGTMVCASCGRGNGLVIYRDDQKYAAKALATAARRPRDVREIDQVENVPSA